MFRNLEAELARKSITRNDLATKLKLTTSTVSLKLSGKANITLSEAMQIKRILNVEIPLEVLFEADERAS